LLAAQLKELSELNLEFDLESTGFSMGEIDLRIEGLAPAPGHDADPADAMPPATAGPPVTHAGDNWVLGDHRVLCGSALDETAYSQLMGKQRATMVFTDPPYNVPIEGNVSGLGAIQHHDFVMGSGEMSEAEFTTFLTQACSLLAQHSTDGSLHYICMDWRHLPELLAAGRVAYTALKNLGVWVKPKAGRGSFYRSQHELVFIFKYGRAPHRNNVQLGKFQRNRTNVWHYPSVSSFGRSGEEGNLLALHPTVKPVALVADAIMDASARSDIVLDAFLGSGTTVIAAERTGRRCYGLELDPRYVDTLIRCWQTYTGGSARRSTDSRSFSELATETEVEDGR
jgi:DNA modification methylase